MPKIADRLEQVQENISRACERSGRSRDHVKLVVVTKTAPLDAVQEVIRLGQRDLGENRVQHLKDVSESVDSFVQEEMQDDNDIRWHMIGHLQRNKVKQALKIATMVHSLDTLRLAEEINTQAGKQGKRMDVLLQANCSGEMQKYGAPVGAVIHLAEQFSTMPNLRMRGLMTMAPLTRDRDAIRSCFVRARELFEEIRSSGMVDQDFTELSMGMSQDYEIAVEEGATILRIGSAIFA